MSDLSIPQINFNPKFTVEKTRNPGPFYLLQLKTISSNKDQKLILIKLEECSTHIKCVGFETKGLLRDIVENYSSLIEKTPNESFIEIMVPWSEVIKVQSLTYRFKGFTK